MNTIYFIGLFLFVSSTQPDPCVHAILPPIPMASGVDAHAMVFMYTGNATLLGDWGTATPSTYDAWNYVKLKSGDRVSFQATPASGTPLVPEELGHLRRKCTRFDHLKAGFTAPNFGGATGVVDIRYGTLKAVTALSPDKSNWRVDTQLQYDSGGPLVMTVVNAGIVRALMLPRGSCGIFAYVPESALTHQYHADHEGEPHAVVFLGMVDANPPAIDCWRKENANTTQINTLRIAQPSPAAGTGGCPPIYQPWVALPAPATPSKSAARASLARNTGSAIAGPACPLPFQPINAPTICPPIEEFLTSDCSNTAWP